MDTFRTKERLPVGPLRQLRWAEGGEVRCAMAGVFLRRRRRRAQPIWSVLLFRRSCSGEWALAGLVRAQEWPTRPDAAEGAGAGGDLRPAAAPGTANNSATSGAKINRPKCRRLALRVFGLCYMRFSHSSSRRQRSLTQRNVHEEKQLPVASYLQG